MGDYTEYLQYINNTNGGATRSHFIEDFEPIGELIWGDLINAGFVRQDQDARIHLTETGEAALTR